LTAKAVITVILSTHSSLKNKQKSERSILGESPPYVPFKIKCDKDNY